MKVILSVKWKRKVGHSCYNLSFFSRFQEKNIITKLTFKKWKDKIQEKWL